MSITLPTTCIVETPKKLAEALVKSVALPRAHWLDPCVGSGMFPDLIWNFADEPEITLIDYRNIAWPEGATFHHADFLTLSRADCEPDIIVANPPYVQLNRLPSDLQARAREVQAFDLRVPGAASYWLAFLVHGLRLLREGGNLAYILPAAYEYADYARKVREQIPKLFRRFEVHRSFKPLFDSVADGCIVVLGFGFLATHESEHKFVYPNLDALVGGLSTQQRHGIALKRTSDSRSALIGDIAEIGIGAVTGDARFFLLSEQGRKQRRIPRSDCVPVISRSVQVRENALELVNPATPFRTSDRRWLFRPESEEGCSGRSKAYLRRGQTGACHTQGYKIKSRTPWFQTPLPSTPEFAFTGMFSRFPSICLLGGGVSITNTLYWLKLKTESSIETRLAFALSLFCSESLDAIYSAVRRYPDGLLKLEPTQVRNLPYCQLQESRVSFDILYEIKRVLAHGDLQACSGLVDILRV